MSGFKAGEHLRVFRGAYFHHGLSIGDGQIIHYASHRSGDDDYQVRCVSLKEFAQGASVDVLTHPDRVFGPARSVARAQSRLGEASYSLVFNNCEHFVNWCIEGESRSQQVEAVMTGAASALGYRYLVAASGSSVAGAFGKRLFAGLGSTASSAGGASLASGVTAGGAGAVAAGLFGGGSLGAAGFAGGLAASSLVAPIAVVAGLGVLVWSLWDD
tara:strand:- start:9406 stop:10050 length:645 start_codon:yes stop_codon:yes gene_type:complete